MSRKLKNSKKTKELDFLMQVEHEINDHETMSLSACLNRIMLNIQYNKYEQSLVDIMKNDFDYVGKKFGICPEETAILACIIEKNTGVHSCDDEDIAIFLGCTNIEFISYRKYLDSLAQKRIVRMSKYKSANHVYYTVLNEAYQAIIDDKDFSEKNFAGINTEAMFSQIRMLFQAYSEEQIDEEMLLNDLDMLVNVNQQNIFSQKIVECALNKLSRTEQRIFYYLCHRYVSFGERSNDLMSMRRFVSEEDDSQKFLRTFQVGKTELQLKGLVSFGGEEGLMDKSQVELSDMVKEEFFNEVDLFCEECIEGHADLVKTEDIIAKELFYNVYEQEQVGRLERLLENESFKGIQTRLTEMGMRKGFNIILYGGPGTGKTETALQLARKTGRGIFCIDMSKIKSKWVGESEKSVKGIFNIYRKLCKKNECKPILFFNEADTIFGKRKENVDSAVEQMLNSIQNIILQEMENIDGIMICTTNLHVNLDPAFERRFIYKIELNNPDEDVRVKIWKSMLKGYDDEQYNTLAQRYMFSGGQIENVTRKSTVDYILNGDKTSLETICKFCDEEMFKSNVRRVGF